MRRNKWVLQGLVSAALVLSACGSKAKEDAEGDGTEVPADGSGDTGDKDGATAPGAPVPGTGPTFSMVTSTAYRVSWEAAKDDDTAATDLEYKLVSASTDGLLDTVEKADAITGSAVVADWTKALLKKDVVNGVRPASKRSYAVLVRDAKGNKSLYAPQTVTTLEPGAPTPGSGITFSEITKSGFRVSWGAATDPEDSAFQYKVVLASSPADIDSIEEILARPESSLNSGWLEDETTHEFSGLSLGTSYAAAVLVRDSDGLKAVYSPVTRNTLPQFLYVTNGKVAGNIGVSGADALCNSDAAKPGAGTYKALLGGGGRVACTTANCQGGAAEHSNDWPLQANRPYGRPDGAIVFVASAIGLPPTNLNARITVKSGSTYDLAAWSGFANDWTTTDAANCSGWVSNSGVGMAKLFLVDDVSSSWFTSQGLSYCNQTRTLVCVEQ